jgi:DUF3099 family protein
VKKQPILITDAARSQNDQFRSRQIRYVTMMGLRAACLVAGAILISARPPWLAFWLILCAAGMVLLPWAAVLIANDRPARTKAERAAALAERDHQAAVLQQLEADSAAPVEYLTIDLEPTDTGERWSPPDPDHDRKPPG